MFRSVFLLFATIVATSTLADAPARIYAQELVDRTVAKHPELAVMVMHVTPPDSSVNVIVASNIGRIGKPADADDLSVLKSGQARGSVNKAGDRFEALMPLKDVSGRVLGVLGLVFPYKSGDDKGRLLASAESIRNELGRRISHVKNLMEPAQFDSRVPIDTYGQQLVDEALAANPDVIILALHTVPPGIGDNVIVASNIGRIGKKADDDDLDVIKTGTPKLELNETGDRFEVEQRLLDVSGDTLGAVGVVFNYKPGDDRDALHRKADQVAAFLQRHISNVKNLQEPYPYVASTAANTFAQQLVDAAMTRHPELLILCIHASTPDQADAPILGCSIGRLGKKADEDDMRVVKTGAPNLEVNAGGNRFEVEEQLHDRSGAVIGALSTVFAYKPGDDKEALHKAGDKIVSELERQIPNRAKLSEPMS